MILTNASIKFSIVELLIKFTYIFNDVYLFSKLQVIKISGDIPKSDIVIIWMSIWNAQSGTNLNS